MNIPDKYLRFLDVCRSTEDSKDGRTPRIPLVQVEGDLAHNPTLNPALIPRANEWFYKAFDWYVAIRLIPGASYGPFYKVDGDLFWPRIGVPGDIYSETDCFFGLERPDDPAHAKDLYALQEDTPTGYVYEFFLGLPESPPLVNAYIWLGPVRGAGGFQVNPNAIVAEMVRSSIVRGEVVRYPHKEGKYDYQKAAAYFHRPQAASGLG